MSHHPVTPMPEADLRLHLARQTALPVELVDLLKLKGWGPGNLGREGVGVESSYRDPARRYEQLCRFLAAAATRNPPPIVLFDTLDDDDLPMIGRLISSQVRPGRQLFCAGSSGVGYALVAYWRKTGILPLMQNGEEAVHRTVSPLEPKQTTFVSGSCSPNTDRQIERALQAGFGEVVCESGSLADSDRADEAVEATILRALPALRAGRHVIFHTARGVTDPRRAAFKHVAEKCAGVSSAQKMAVAGARLGHALGRVLRSALELTRVRRAVICGGDTATLAGRAMGIVALEFLVPAIIGAPLCRIHASGSALDGCELICKGGQVGPDSFFLDLVSEGVAPAQRRPRNLCETPKLLKPAVNVS